MDKETLEFLLSTTSKNFQSTIQSRSDLCFDYEEIDEDDEYSTEFPCPYCSEELDIVELCCHIDDEHYGEGKPGLCPVCAMRVGMNMVAHITTQHGNILKIQHKLKLLRGDPHSASSLALKKELQDEHLKCLLEGPSCVVSSSNMAADPLLSSFMYNMPMIDASKSVQPSSLTEASLAEETSDEDMLKRNIQPSPLSDKDQEEKAQRSEFVQGLLWSTILDDDL